MGTKTEPGPHDCYAAARPHEPMFVLLGRDPAAWAVVLFWTMLRKRLASAEADADKLAEAERCAAAMLKYAEGIGKSDECDKMQDLVARSLVKL